MSKKKLNKKVWYSSEVDVSGNPILPPLAENPEDLEGLHEGELFLHNSDDYPSIWIRTKNGLIKPLIGGQSNTPSYWEVRELPNGDTYLYTSLPIVTQSGVTMYADGGILNLPSIYDGLPIDNNTIYWEDVDGYRVLKAKGGGGIAESVSWADITGKPEWLLDGKISYSEVEGTPDLSVYALKRSLSEYVTKTELTNLDYADKDWVKQYVVDINTGNITAITKQMVIEALGYTPYDNANPNGYVTSESIPSLDGYATEDWVIKKGYLTSIPSEYITESELTAKGYATALSVTTALGNKVDKVNGKGLSTEDFTTALKTKLEGLNNYNDTAISNAVTKLRNDFDALVDGDTSTAIDNFNEIIAFLDGVQDNQDLSSIIASIEQQIAAKYTKPSGGIPKSDLVQAVQTSLGKADSALQSHQSIYTLTFQSGTFASGSFTANSGNKTINIPTTTSHVSEGSNLYFTNARAVSALGDTLKSYVTLSGSQTVSGEKNFTGGLKVNGSPIVYDAAKKYWKLEGDLLITGGLTMYGSDSSFTPSTIMDAIAVDGTTISKDGGVLRVIGGGSGSISEITKQMVIDALGFTPISSSDIPTSLPNPHSLKFGSKLYDGSASKTILASDLGITWDDILGRPTLLSSFTDDVVAGKYLPLTGGTIISARRETLFLRSSDSYGPVLDLQDSKGNIISEIGHIPSSASNYNYGAFWTNIESKIGFVLGNDGIAYVTTNPNTLSPRYAIWHKGNFTPANYLPLSGGTISGTTNTPIAINTTATNEVGLRFDMSGVNKGWVGYTPNIGIYLYSYGKSGVTHKLGISDSGAGIIDSYALYHTGNLTKLSQLTNDSGFITSSASISGNAATATYAASARCLTAQQATTDDFGSYLSTYGANGLSVIVNTSGADVGNIGVMGSVLNIGHVTSRLGRFLFQRHEYSEALYWQSANGTGTGWGAKRTLAFTDSNVSSATKLQTARTIWGQSFDGTGDISGDITLLPTEQGDNKNSAKLRFLTLKGRDTSPYIQGIQNSSGYSRQRLSFFQTDAASYTPSYYEAMTILPNGNVGIGTTSPAAKLEVNGNISALHGIFGKVLVNKGYGDNVGDQTIETSSKGLMLYLQYYHNGGINLCQGGGNVGIGTTSPSAKLEVNGNVAFGGAATFYDVISVNRNGSSGAILNTSKSALKVECYNTYTSFNTYTGGGVSNPNVFVLKDNGNIGIGTTSPSQKLHVDGNILTTGGVTMYGSSDRRLKKNIRTFNASQELMKLGGIYEFEYIDEEIERNDLYKGIHVGLIYQNVKGTILEKMRYEREDGYGALNYLDTSFICLIAAVGMEHETRLQKLERENIELKKELAYVRGRLEDN